VLLIVAEQRHLGASNILLFVFLLTLRLDVRIYSSLLWNLFFGLFYWSHGLLIRITQLFAARLT